MFTKSYGEVFEGDERWNSLEVPEGDRYAWADDSTYVRQPPFFDDLRARAVGHRGHRGRARARRARRLGDDRPHLARGRDQEGLAGGEVPQRARRRQQGLQLLRRPPRQPRGDDARHVRQHPPAQRDRRQGADRRAHAEVPRGRRAADLRRRDEVRRGRHAAGRARRARSTARAPRATGPPRAPTCSACAR